jgi:predicted DsbA family dithiol-disulfide isomerase
MAHVAGSDDIAPMHEKVTKAGEAAGLTFHFDKIEKRPSSMLAHMAIMAAPVESRERLLEALHTAYFEDGRDIGEREVILAIAAELGLEPKAIGAALSYPQWREMVSEVSEQAKQIAADGVRGVPFFVFNDMLSLAGAYPAPQLVQAWTKAQELTAEKQKQAEEQPEPSAAPADSTVEANAAAQPDPVVTES